jgi:hypothetical protein
MRAMRSAWLLVARTAAAVAAVASAACGRIGFDEAKDAPAVEDARHADAAPGDTGGSGDAAPGACRTNADYGPAGGSAHAYKVVANGDASWEMARVSCEADGAYLAILDDAAEAGLLPGNGWIGATDAAMEGVWLTVRGAPAPFLPWKAGEPNGGTTENCARFDSGLRQLESRRCTDLRDWTCECD